ncbi:hypothetical protein [Flavobacterium psychrophilum]|uniref:hypothetical protein n=1 Tax=Flavobacterium psychrophilum TaxID=96345 RepID=UPI000B7C4CA2|nr:hypothetical protein [Flavobacterium psychrophilum]MCB6070916.1 hypothetical protein [Flavobacterium psychrophilum]MCB6108199.1 hypothetical protein [Flavobacterium psychrophilum]SNB07199.1 hypothetical protein IT2_350103 [Flavobacterium psychrophilum]SNB44110.1 hypothetical protein LVDJXP189_790014 [Flavobacterium psychrophilum]
MAKEDKDLKNVFASRKAKEVEKAKATEVETTNNLDVFVARFGQDQIDKWKKQFAGRSLIALAVGDQLAVLRPPTADDLGDYMTAIGSSGMSKAVAMIVEQLWLDGDYSLIEDEDSFIAVFLQVNNILEGKKAEFFRF